MSRRILWKIEVVTPSQAEASVAELLESRFGQSPSIFEDLETGKTTVSVYLQEKPSWTRKEHRDLVNALNQIEAISSNRTRLRASLKKLRNEDWAEAWKRHFKPLEIGSSLLIKPSWSRRLPVKGQQLVQLDPGMSFGTGQHPTTAFCLKELARLRRLQKEQSFLDIGSGSGILAICAAKLGYRPVHAIELDQECVRIARLNARTNQVSKRIDFRCQDISTGRSDDSSQYALICANLISTLLLAERKRLVGKVAPGGHLVLAGILEAEFSEIRSAYEQLGLQLVRTRREREWRSGCFIRRFWG